MEQKEQTLMEFALSYKNDDSTIWALKIHNYAKSLESAQLAKNTKGREKYLKTLRLQMQQEIDSWDDLSGAVFDLLLKSYAESYFTPTTPERRVTDEEIENALINEANSQKLSISKLTQFVSGWRMCAKYIKNRLSQSPERGEEGWISVADDQKPNKGKLWVWDGVEVCLLDYEDGQFGFYNDDDDYQWQTRESEGELPVTHWNHIVVPEPPNNQ